MSEKDNSIKGIFKRFFDPNKDGKGVEKQPRAPLTLKNFFPLYWRNITTLLYINLVYMIGNFPAFFALYAMTGNLNTNSFGAASPMFAPLYGAMTLSGNINPAAMALFGVHGVQSTVSLMTPATYVFFALSLLIIFTWGFVSVGCTYLIRSIVRGDPIFFFHDFFYAIKRNLRQGLIIGMLDCFIIGLLTYNIVLSYYNMFNFSFTIVFYSNIALLLLYSMMRFFIYILLITFKFNIYQIFKNSLIFALVNIKRNVIGFLGCALCVFICYYLLSVFAPISITLVMILFFSTTAFIGCYAAYPKIKEVLIDPYYTTDEPAVD